MATKESGFEMLARLIKQESDDIRQDLGGKIAQLEYKVDSGFASLRADHRSVRRDVDELQETVRKHEGYAKEIDHVMQRTTRIEKRLGIKNTASNK